MQYCRIKGKAFPLSASSFFTSITRKFSFIPIRLSLHPPHTTTTTTTKRKTGTKAAQIKLIVHERLEKK